MKYKKLPHLILAIILSMAAAQAQQLPTAVFKQMKARSVGPAVMGGRITAIDAVVSNPDIMYAGAASGGVWKSENGGTSWTPVFDEQSNINIGSLAIQQSNPSVIWVGTGEGNPRNSVNMGNGIYKSINGGRTWKHMGLDKTSNIHRVIIDPTNPAIVYAGVIGSPWGNHKERGVFKTTNGGQTWEQVLYTNEKSGVADMVMDPTNPSKLIVAMWQHRRTPWDFTSGGPGSGLYMTYDGGRNWQKKGEADGLPKGDFGRIGVAISRSMPNRIYAMVEATKNGLYRSDNGGEKWTLVTDEPSIVTDRPFYYNEIYVDTKNENRIYKLSAPLSYSEDAGKTFKVLATPDQVHSDHQSFWIHPENPDLLIDGNDGGLAISRDHGKTWMNPEGITAGQYYHINVDNEVPYNIYGGLQDNGSWTGPAYTFHNGGIRNSHWQAIILADGFDVVPDPADARYGYAMSQGGNIVRYDKQTGANSFVKPTITDVNTRLRFNWNTAIAPDPFNKGTIYAGSQFVHKSTDRGMSWQPISGDLTLNDPQHQKQDYSGGLTLDATNAENHNNILTIAPSTLQKDVLWVGTDDGNVHLTRDGGKSWSNLSKRIPGLPEEAWIAQITASRHNAGEAFVVANVYRMGSDYAPYIYRTTDFGKSWTRLVDDKKVKGYALSFLQDSTEPRLMFAGTENGLWVSIDAGRNWSKWDQGIPASVPVMDLAIQEREADLVIGTFGRSIYVLDNIRPLRQLAATGVKLLDKPVVAFAPSDAYLAAYRGPQGYGKDAENLYQAENRPAGANLTFYLKPKPSITLTKGAEASGNLNKIAANTSTAVGNAGAKSIAADTLYINIYNEANKLIQTLKQIPASGLGVQRLTWDLTEKEIRMPGLMVNRRGGNAGPSGNMVLPGRFKLLYSYAGAKDSSFVNVMPDPRMPFNKEVAVARYALQERVDKNISQLTVASDRIIEATEATKVVLTQIKGKTGKEYEDLRKSTLEMQKSLESITELIAGKKSEMQGLGRPYMLTAMVKLQEASSYISRRQDAPTQTEVQLIEQAQTLTGSTLDKIDNFFSTQWGAYSKKVQASPLKIVKEYSSLERASIK